MTTQTTSKIHTNPQLYTEPAKSKKHYCTIDLHAEDSRLSEERLQPKLKANFPRKETRVTTTPDVTIELLLLLLFFKIIFYTPGSIVIIIII